MTIEQARRILDAVRDGTGDYSAATIQRALKLTGDLPVFTLRRPV